MQSPLSLDALREQFKNQNSELARIQEVLRSLDPHLCVDVESDALEAIGTALEVTIPSHGSSSLPTHGMRA